MPEDITNEEIVEKLYMLTGTQKPSELADYLTTKYGKTVKRQQVEQFIKVNSVTVTGMMLREFLEAAEADKS